MHGHRKPTSFLLLTVLFVSLATLAGPTQAQEDKAKEEEAAKLGVEAVVYGFPLVIVDVTKRVQTNVEEPNHSGHAPVNQFSNFLKYPTAAYKDVVRMNVDTLYSFAWLDLSKEPIILSVPDTDGRYYLMPVLDAYTNVFVSPGKRTTGTKAGHFAIVGPDWKVHATRWRQGTEISDQHRHDRWPNSGERPCRLRSRECDPEAIQTDAAECFRQTLHPAERSSRSHD